MRRSDLRTFAAWALCFGLAASTALVTASCTNDFASLYADQGSSGSGAAGSGGGASSSSGSASSSSGGGQPNVPAGCVVGQSPTGEAAKPPSAAFGSLCGAPEGCRNTAKQPSTLACNVCGATCNDFDCVGGECEIWCSEKTTCRNEECTKGGNKCSFYCDGCDGQFLGSAPDITARCSGGANCDLLFDTGNQNTVTVDCSGSKCTLLGQAKNINGACRQNSTCDISCKNDTCIFGVTCDATSRCLFHCDTANQTSCPKPQCSSLIDCGTKGWACGVPCPG